MGKFSKKRIAILLASLSVSGGKSSAMNKSETKVESSRSLETVKGGAISDNKNLNNKIPAPPQNLPKNLKPLYYALAAFGISIAVVLVTLGVEFFGKKPNKKNNKIDSQNDKKINQEKPKGKVFVVQGTIEEVKKKGDEFFGHLDTNRKYGEWHKQNLSFDKKVLDANGGLNNKHCLIYFEESSNDFECWEIDKNEKLLCKVEISEFEKKVIKKHIDLFKDKLNIIPSYVSRFGNGFRFGFDFSSGEKIRGEGFPGDIGANPYLFVCKEGWCKGPTIII